MKSCANDHLIEDTEYLRLGTLDYFRKLPIAKIGDSGEAALLSRVVVDRPTVLPSKLFSAIQTGAILYGDASGSLRRPFEFAGKKIHLGKVDSKDVEILECDFRYRTSGSDALIFCMKATKNKWEEPDLGYENSWKINRDRAPRFGSRILRKLNELWSTNPSLFVDTIGNDGAQFQMRHGPVRYRNRSIELINPSIKEVTGLAHMLENSDMYKSLDFNDQDEYRFCFRLVKARKLLKLRPSLKNIDIEADEFRKYSV